MLRQVKTMNILYTSMVDIKTVTAVSILNATTSTFNGGFNYVLSFGRQNCQAFDFIFSKIGIIISKRGLFAGSSFMQIFTIRDMWCEIPGGILMRRPSSATWWTATQQVLILTQWNILIADAWLLRITLTNLLCTLLYSLTTKNNKVHNCQSSVPIAFLHAIWIPMFGGDKYASLRYIY